MANLDKILIIDNNNIYPPLIENPIKSPVVQTNTSCLSIHKKKILWILFSITLIILTTSISIIIILKKNSMAVVPTTSFISTTTTTAIIIIVTTTTTTDITSTVTTTTTAIETEVPIYNFGITKNTKWKQHGYTVAGGGESGNQLNQLASAESLYIDDEAIYIADGLNHRIMKWKHNATSGEIVAGGNGKGNATNQLDGPKCVIVDKENDSLIICDRDNRRVVQWPRQNATEGKIIITNTDCHGLAMDDRGYLYVVDFQKDEVKRWKIGEKNGTIVAGGNGRGSFNNQLRKPHNIFIGQNYSIYVSDTYNHRVMKWIENATEGIVVTDRNDCEDKLKQLNYPMTVFVDQLDNIYVTDNLYDRIMRWLNGTSEGNVILGGMGLGSKPNQFDGPFDLSLDRKGSIYIADARNHRVQKFYIDSN